MSGGPLTSNHVNYLVWRYLQESGHGQTAARLQRDWGQDPEALPFARHIGTHALISLVQKGLQYHEIESSIDQYGRPKSPAPSFTYFGPESDPVSSSPNGNAVKMDEDEVAYTSPSSPQTRKHPRAENVANGVAHHDPPQAPAPKRTRRSHGTAPTTNGNHVQPSDMMEIDQNGSHDYSTELKHDPAHADSPAPATAAAAAHEDSTMDVDGDGDVDAEADGADLDAAETEALAADDSDGALQGEATAVPAPMDMGMSMSMGDMGEDLDRDSPIVTPTLTLTNGRSVGVQSDKVAELGPETTVLRMPPSSSNFPHLNGGTAKHNVTTHATWNPRDPAILATGGETLCRIWSLTNATLAEARAHAAVSPDSPSTTASPTGSKPFVDLQELSDTATVTSMAWSPDGENLAVAVHDSEPTKGTIFIKSKGGESIDELPGGQAWILNLTWNPSGSFVFGIAHSDDTKSSLMIWDLATGQPIEPFELDKAVYDVVWLDDNSFMVCGDSFIAHAIVNDHVIEALSERSPDISRVWSKIRYCPVTRTVAVATDGTGDLAIIDASDQFQTIRAHSADITALIFQPLSNPSAYLPSSPRLLATSSTDGSIKIWDAKQPFDLVHTLTIGRSSPVMAMSFTGDGYLVAAASWNRILFWNAEMGGMPKATWTGKEGEWQTVEPHTNGDVTNGQSTETLVHSLSWDADGGKLAYSLRDQIAIINFRRPQS